MKYFKVLLILMLNIFVACKRTDQPIKDIIHFNKQNTTTNVSSNDTTNIEIYPHEDSMQTEIMPTGFLHEDELDINFKNKIWYGIFIEKGKKYIAKTHMQALKVHDPIIDEYEEEKTGWDIKTNSADSCILLIEASPYISEKTISTFALPEETILPGDTVTFQFLNHNYTIYATGTMNKSNGENKYESISNYKLYISTIKDKKTINTLLVAQPNFEDAMIIVLFAGDIDGDGILDLILDTSNQYNVSKPTLYLSKPAAENKILKPMGFHQSVGC